MKSLAEQIRSQIGAPYHVLGTDGFGRSDTREELRHFFEVDRRFVTLAALKSLADAQKIGADTVVKARDELAIDPDKPNPRLVLRR
jgi:pyruvate dehydrogenase E1 component